MYNIYIYVKIYIYIVIYIIIVLNVSINVYVRVVLNSFTWKTSSSPKKSIGKLQRNPHLSLAVHVGKKSSDLLQASDPLSHFILWHLHF